MLVKIAKKVLPEGRLRNTLKSLYHDYRFLKVFYGRNKEFDIRYDKADDLYQFRFKSGPLKGIELNFPGNLHKTSFFEIPTVLEGYFSSFEPRQDDIIIDAGAFPGDFAVAAAKMKVKKVLALEPDPKNRSYLESMIKSNNIQDRIIVLPYALSDKNDFSHLSQNYSGSRISDIPSPEMIPVETKTLDTLISKMGIGSERIIIKMDIEGAELKAVDGASKMINMGAEFIIASYHMVKGRKTAETLRNVFQNRGYNVFSHYPKHLTLVAKPF